MNRDDLRTLEIVNWILLILVLITDSSPLLVVLNVSFIVELVLTYNYYKNHDE